MTKHFIRFLQNLNRIITDGFVNNVFFPNYNELPVYLVCCRHQTFHANTIHGNIFCSFSRKIRIKLIMMAICSFCVIVAKIDRMEDKIEVAVGRGVVITKTLTGYLIMLSKLLAY